MGEGREDEKERGAHGGGDAVGLEQREQRVRLVGARRGALGFFFFQAEDGIRDVAVTGVQTCALPISGRWTVRRGRWWLPTSSGCMAANLPSVYTGTFPPGLLHWPFRRRMRPYFGGIRPVAGA